MKKKTILTVAALTALCVSQAVAGDIFYEGDLGLGPGFGSVVGSGNTNCGLCGDGNGADTLDFWQFTLATPQTVTITGTRLDSNLDLAFALFSGLTTANYADRDGVRIYRDGNGVVLGLTNVGVGDDEVPVPVGPYGDPQLTTALAAGDYTVIVSAGIGSGPDPANSYIIALEGESLVELPEPSTYVMLLTGLAGAAAFGRRRKQ